MILQHFADYKSCVSLLAKMVSNKTLAPYITISSIIDFIIVKILIKVDQHHNEPNSIVKADLEEYTDLLVILQNAVAQNTIFKRILEIGQESQS